MKRKMVKKLICTVLTFTLVFCTVAMFPSTASAAYGDPSSFGMAVGNYTFSGSVYFNSNKTAALATTSYGITAGLTSEVEFYYAYYDPQFGKTMRRLLPATASTAGTTVTATIARKSEDIYQFHAVYADGVHRYSGYGGSEGKTTRIYS